MVIFVCLSVCTQKHRWSELNIQAHTLPISFPLPRWWSSMHSHASCVFFGINTKSSRARLPTIFNCLIFIQIIELIYLIKTKLIKKCMRSVAGVCLDRILSSFNAFRCEFLSLSWLWFAFCLLFYRFCVNSFFRCAFICFVVFFCTSFSHSIRLRFIRMSFGCFSLLFFFSLYCISHHSHVVYLCHVMIFGCIFLAALCRDFVEANYRTPHIN